MQTIVTFVMSICRMTRRHVAGNRSAASLLKRFITILAIPHEAIAPMTMKHFMLFAPIMVKHSVITAIIVGKELRCLASCPTGVMAFWSNALRSHE